ncbi:MAG: hypothetical protein V1738_05395 [Patescibacteria group bacterium]
MKNEFTAYGVVAVLSFAQAAVISAWPFPFAVINLPLIYISALALGLQPKIATVAAVISGLIIDMLSSGIGGVNTIAATSAVLITMVLLFRVLTHHTFGAVAGGNASIFILFHLLVFAINSVSRVLAGGSIIHPATGYAILIVVLALPLQIFLALSLHFVNLRLHNYAGRYLLVK